jgi:glyoxylase-like metal-dependent hydrolase (beta-lactamase superfamily II)
MTARTVWRGLAALGILLVLLAATAVYWLFYDNRMAAGRFPLDLAAIRAEADTMPGAVPDRIEVEVLSFQQVPRIAMQAGADWAPVDLIRTSYRLVWPDRSLIIDTGHDEKSARATGVKIYMRPAWARLQAALKTADTIVVTHEHGDHIGGLAASPALASIAPRALLLPEQAALLPAARRGAVQPLRHAQLQAIAPGVVLIRAAGHTPGSQMVYVRRGDGHEYIFMGDIASLAGNVVALRARSRLVADHMAKEDRQTVLLQLQALQRLALANPDVTLVPGHDGTEIGKMITAGWLTPQFQPAPPPPVAPLAG